MNRSARSKIAQETLNILEKKSYINSSGEVIQLSHQIDRCVTESQCFQPQELAEIENRILASLQPYSKTEIIISNETTLEGAKTLIDSLQFSKIGVLNFASAKNPGGGFLGRSQAQEESLARSSALYLPLNSCFEYYEAHRRLKTLSYSDRTIYSPNCPVFRNARGDL